MKLPIPPAAYSRLAEVERNRMIEAADRQNIKRETDIEPGDGRLILRSPNGTRWSITVSNAGTITATAI